MPTLLHKTNRGNKGFEPLAHFACSADAHTAARVLRQQVRGSFFRVVEEDGAKEAPELQGLLDPYGMTVDDIEGYLHKIPLSAEELDAFYEAEAGGKGRKTALAAIEEAKAALEI